MALDALERLADLWTRTSVAMEGCPIPTEACQAIGCDWSALGCYFDAAITEIRLSTERAMRERSHLLPIVEGQLAVRSFEDEVHTHHEHCPICSVEVPSPPCAELGRLCDMVEMAAGKYEADLANWEISDTRASLAPTCGLSWPTGGP